MKRFLRTIENETKEATKEVRKKTVSYITAGFGLVAGLAWNEAIKELIAYLFPLAQNSLVAKFAYAIVMTVIIVALGMYLGRMSVKEESGK